VTRRSGQIVLFVALFCVSTSGPFLVMSKMSAYAVVFWRMALSAPLFLAWAAWNRALTVQSRHAPRIIVGALLLATHFVLWVKAFDLTDYASNLILLVSQPVCAAVLAVRLGERRIGQVWLSIVLALAGLIVITGGDVTLGRRALIGDLFCILGSFAIALFYVVTREARRETALSTFMGATFVVGSLAVLPLVLLSGVPIVRYPPASWGWLAVLVMVTTVMGHGLMNLAARHVSLFTLNLVIVLEPAIGIGMGAMMFGAAIKPLAIAGGALLVAAVVIGLRESGDQKSRIPMA
jgi:drug/metabolite transporter (DMT)-like permease